MAQYYRYPPTVISGTVTSTSASTGTNGVAAPGSTTQVGGPDSSGNLQPIHTYDGDTGAGTENIQGVLLRLPASGGSVAGGTSANPVRVDPTGTTTQPVSIGAMAYADSVRKDYSGGSVGTGAWVQLIAATAATIKAFWLWDSGGFAMELGTGAAAAETRILLIPPGGFSDIIPIGIPSGTRLSVRGVGGTASTGELDFTGVG